jgi:hypothetical protein
MLQEAEDDIEVIYDARAVERAESRLVSTDVSSSSNLVANGLGNGGPSVAATDDDVQYVGSSSSSIFT